MNAFQTGPESRRPILRGACLLLAAIALSACGPAPSPSNVGAPGTEKRVGTSILETGAAVLQDKPPVDALSTYLDGFHFYDGRMNEQMEAHHFCAILNEDVVQCTIFDGNLKTAKLMGVEYIVSARIFESLPEAEKSLWHSHVHEVKSGQLVAPGIPEAAEHALMTRLVGTYGKTFHTWHTDRQENLPLGMPQVMMGFTADGQVDPAMVAARDARLGVDSAAKRRQREDIPVPAILPGADAWARSAATPALASSPVHPQHRHSPASVPSR